MKRKHLKTSQFTSARKLFSQISGFMGAAALAAAAFFGQEADAAAQTRFGDKGQLAISAENLFAFSSESLTVGSAAGDGTVTTNRLGFLLSSASGPVTGTRVGGHYFIIPSLSIGGTIGFESRGSSLTTPRAGGSVTTTGPDGWTLAIQPKVGYALMLNDVLGFWFRGGLGYVRDSTTNAGGGKNATNLWLLSADALLVVSPVQHFAFYVGPQANLSLTGSQVITGGNGAEQSWSSSFRSIGVGTGLIGYFNL